MRRRRGLHTDRGLSIVWLKSSTNTTTSSSSSVPFNKNECLTPTRRISHSKYHLSCTTQHTPHTHATQHTPPLTSHHADTCRPSATALAPIRAAFAVNVMHGPSRARLASTSYPPPRLSGLLLRGKGRDVFSGFLPRGKGRVVFEENILRR